MENYLSRHPEFHAVAVGALVFSDVAPSHVPPGGPDAASGTCDHILLIQRAASDSMPLLWEIPGGACDPDDESILHGMGRELWEESGLVLTAVVGRAGGDVVFFTRRGLPVCKHTFEVEVRAEAGTLPDVTLDPNEHQAYLWATEDECRAGRKGDVELKFTTKDQENCILEGFRLRNARREVVGDVGGPAL
jgi:8-oxo-dGTP pyrophosphatase MutT (NUDIX family)